MNNSKSKKVIVLGGGFAGVYSVIHLIQYRNTDDNLDVVLINKENYMVFQPLLTEVISGTIDLTHCISPIRRLCPGAKLYTREIEKIDLEKKIITTSPSIKPTPLELSYDYLVIALGMVNNFSELPGLKEHALPFRNMADALILRNHLIHLLEEADNEQDQAMRHSLLTFVVGGGGFSGVEVAAELNDFVRDIAKRYFSIRNEEIKVILVHSGGQILPELTSKLGSYAMNLLTKKGVEFRLKNRVASTTADTVILQSGEKIMSRTLISTVPAGPNPLIADMECEKEKGRIKTDSYLKVEGVNCAWAVGDCALVPLKDDEVCPPTAQFAVRQAKVAAQNLLEKHRGTEKYKKFTFSGLGKTGALGKHSAVAEIFGMRISGIIAWFLWRTIYWWKMPGWDRKIRVGADWLLGVMLPDDLVQLKVDPSHSFSLEYFQANEYIFRKGDIGDRMYVIIKGEVEILLEENTKHPVSITLGPDQYFGEMALFSGESRMASVVTKTPVNVMSVTRSEFNMLVKYIPAIKKVFELEIQRRKDENIQRSEE
jgi:NADH dehydrogenase